MGSFTLAVPLALIIGLVFPCWAGVIRQACNPGETYADIDDNTRYYRCLGDGHIKMYYCTEGDKSCEEEGLCCGEENDSTRESWSVERVEEGSQMDDSGHEVQSSEESSKTAEDENSYEFVGKGYQFTSTHDEADVKPAEETAKSTEYEEEGSKEDGESRDESEHEETYTNVEKVSAEDDGELIQHIGSEINHDSSSADTVVSLYGVDNESGNRDEDEVNEPHNVVIVEMADTDSSESNEKSLEDSHSVEHSIESGESKETAESGDYRWKRNANDEDDEKGSSNEKADEEKEDNSDNQKSDVESSTTIGSSTEDTSEGQSQSDTDSTEKKNSDEISSPESTEDNVSLETSEIPTAGTHVAVNPSEVANFKPLPLSYMDYRAQQIIQIVRSILRLTDEKPTPIHREMLSPEKYDDAKS